MDSREFVSAYPKDVSEERIYRGGYPDYVKIGQGASYIIGRFLHDTLSGNPPDSFIDPEEVAIYDDWLEGMTAMESRMLGDPSAGLRAWNEINFHSLNRHMLDLWRPLRNGGWRSEKERTNTITVAQNSLALAGMEHYVIRERLKDAYHGTEALFAPENQADHGRFTGVIQEFDAAIILLDIMRHNANLTVVPAPMQFEHTNPHTNVDFVVVDFIGQRAVGVQVKTQVNRQHLEKYDTERVVLVDGVVDLGNVKVVRIKKGTSKEAPKPWPGIISTKQVDLIKTSGNRSLAPTEVSAHLLRRKFQAKQLVGSLRVDYRNITSRVNERILAKL